MSGPRPGVCGLCGCAVLQPKDDPRPGWNRPLGDMARWDYPAPSYGHFHGSDGRLEKVRCMNCSLWPKVGPV